MTHFIIVREESPGRFIARPAGIPEVTAFATTRQDAIDAALLQLNRWLADGHLVPVQLIVPELVAAPAAEDADDREGRAELGQTLSEYRGERSA
jgi:hypothetical protein